MNSRRYINGKVHGVTPLKPSKPKQTRHAKTPQGKEFRERFRRDPGTFTHIYPGAFVKPDPLWNRTTPNPKRKLPALCQVREISVGTSQSGILVLVKNMGGEEVWLDANWFLTPAGNLMVQVKA